MLRKILTAICFIFITTALYSQCAIEKWTLEKRFDLSTLVVEGKVIDQYPFRENGKRTIYTASVIEVYKIFKGQLSNPEYIEVITFGGQIGLERHRADPELEVQKDEMGIFLLVNNKVSIPDFIKQNGKAKFQGTASVQSFITYDLTENKAYDVSSNYTGITTTLYETMQMLSGKKYTDVKSSGYDPSRLNYRPLASPVITSYGSSSANAGTGDILTVNGQGFGNIRGNGRIEFVDANFGDGRRVKTPYAADYSVWNDTQIKVRIPTRAGTGTIKVNTNDSGTFTSFNSFKINFSHLNANYTPTGGKEQYYTTDHINKNEKGGYTFQFNKRFKTNSNMVNSFLRSLESWRCGSFMNWEVGRDTTINTIDPDEVNIVKLTDFPDSKLAVCYSYFNGCYTTGINMDWYVVEMDIEVDSTIKWYYGVGSIANDQYDFQSVLTHELGHGHQLGHIIESTEIMHWSIKNGVKNSVLSTRDITGGQYVKNKSININVCSVKPLKALTSNTCGYVVPIAGFKVDKLTGCLNVPVTYTDTSKGVIKNYSWKFGTDANPATITGKGPHNVTYSSTGKKTVILYVSNDFGIDTLENINYLDILPLKPPTPVNLVYQDTGCLASTVLSVDSFAGPISFTWQLPAPAFVISSTKNTKTISWTSAGGPYTFWVKSTNLCGSSDSVVGKVIVLNNTTASFTALENGREVTFTNASQFASSYKWLFGDGDSSSSANPVHTYPTKGTFNVTLKAINKCKTVSFKKDVNPFHPVGIESVNVLNTLVFPNPSSGILNLSKDIRSYILMDATGKILTTGKSSEIDLSGYAKGIYIINADIYNGQNIFIKVIRD